MELKDTLENIFSNFKTSNKFLDYSIFNSGHINDTYLIVTDKKPYYVLQKINGTVFKDAKNVILNKVKVCNFLLNQKKVKTLEFVYTKNNNPYFIDEDYMFWNLCLYIENTKTFLTIKHKKLAFEAGKITGKFLHNTANFNDTLVTTLPNFHRMDYRLKEYEIAVRNASNTRLKYAKKWMLFINNHQHEMQVLDKALLNKEIPIRVTHNDTKISNILFTKNEKALCLIDLDTVMKGIIHYDYGDALRTICATATEDEKELSKVSFDMENFKNYTSGFLSSLKNAISKKEIALLPASIKTMTFIIGLRFLTDYLNNDMYFKTTYRNHNLDRAINQFTMVTKIIENMPKIEAYINNFKSS
ncbi:aminoglycoside phosphotransferase family protein [Polaribacter tangerinus]|uniref:phosphotransferase n=1 Tax=Polaribacter tangerinus TaxID=1920034 RepID=UPI000B4A83A5|nr:aminoglycoside phosphotransferase family protein [Polaribacter tangerinus]